MANDVEDYWRLLEDYWKGDENYQEGHDDSNYYSFYPNLSEGSGSGYPGTDGYPNYAGGNDYDDGGNIYYDDPLFEASYEDDYQIEGSVAQHGSGGGVEDKHPGQHSGSGDQDEQGEDGSGDQEEEDDGLDQHGGSGDQEEQDDGSGEVATSGPSLARSESSQRIKGSGGGSNSYDDLDEEEDDDLSYDDDDLMEHNDLFVDNYDEKETGSSPHDRETNGSGEGRNTQRKGRAPSQALKKLLLRIMWRNVPTAPPPSSTVGPPPSFVPATSYYESSGQLHSGAQNADQGLQSGAGAHHSGDDGGHHEISSGRGGFVREIATDYPPGQHSRNHHDHQE